MGSDDARVLSNERCGPDLWVATLEAPRQAAAARAGQFAMVEAAPGFEPLLRRAFSYYDAEPDTGRIRLLYQVVGAGTRLMSGWAPGRTVSLLGPLGRGFPPPAAEAPLLLVGGGVGLAPFLLALRQLRRERPDQRATLLAGARTGAQLAFLAEFERWTPAIEIATDDGSRGHRGPVTELLAAHWDAPRAGSVRDGLDAGEQEPGASATGGSRPVADAPGSCSGSTSGGAAWACGPWPMLAAVARLAAARGRDAWVSVETPMACGFGACYGCAVALAAEPSPPRLRSGPAPLGAGDHAPHFSRACVDGPVYEARRLRWER